MKKLTLLLTTLCFSLAWSAEKPQLILSFDGKGTAMSWDVGVIKALYEKLQPEVWENPLIVGASSGSIMAVYFACNGINEQSIQRATELAKKFPKAVLDEQTSQKTIQLVLGNPTESSMAPLLPILDEVTNRGTCIPKHPLLIPAANLEVVEGREKIEGRIEKPFSGVRGRIFDQRNYTLANKNGEIRGKVCTYFVNEAMATVLERVPAEERLCDLRVVKTGSEFRRIIDYSTAEPTYYVPVAEPEPAKVVSLYPVSRNRHYAGGFILNMAGQDVKRATPAAWTIGTGRTHYSRVQNRMILNWFSFPMNKTLLDQRWFVDEQFNPTPAEWEGLYEKDITPTEQIERGRRKTVACLAQAKGCRPKAFTKPFYFKDFDGNDLTELRHRGIRSLLKK